MSELYIDGKKIFDDAKVKELEESVTTLESKTSDKSETLVTLNSGFTTGDVGYCVKNGICFIRLSGVIPTAAGNDQVVCTGLPKSKIFQGTFLTSASKDAHGYIYIPTNGDYLVGNISISGYQSWAAFSYPVADDWRP